MTVFNFVYFVFPNVCFVSVLRGSTHELNLASHLGKTWQEASTCRRLQDDPFCKIEQEGLARSCKHQQDSGLARSSKINLQALARLTKTMISKIEQDLARTSKMYVWQVLARWSLKQDLAKE